MGRTVARLPRKAQIFLHPVLGGKVLGLARATLRGKNRLYERGACAGWLTELAGTGPPGRMELAVEKGLPRLLEEVAFCLERRSEADYSQRRP